MRSNDMKLRITHMLRHLFAGWVNIIYYDESPCIMFMSNLIWVLSQEKRPSRSHDEPGLDMFHEAYFICFIPSASSDMYIQSY